MAKKSKNNTLLAFLEEQNPDELIYLGTEEGGGWLLIDSAENVINSLYSLNQKLYRSACDNYDRLSKKIENLPYLIVKNRDELNKCKFMGTDEDEAKFKAAIRRYESDFVKAYELKNKYKSIIDKWKPVHKRDVVEHYHHKTEVTGTCVLITGYEKGSFWFKSEYDKANKK